MIWEALKKSLIVKEMEADSCEDVFRQLGGALIREGYAKSTYIEALCTREKDYPTGLDIRRLRRGDPPHGCKPCKPGRDGHRGAEKSGHIYPDGQ